MTIRILTDSTCDLTEEFVYRHLLPEGNIMVEEINPVLGAHIGPGVVGFACISKK